MPIDCPVRPITPFAAALLAGAALVVGLQSPALSAEASGPVGGTAAATLASTSSEDNADRIPVAPEAQAPAAKTWREDIGTFRFGIVRNWSADLSDRARNRLQRALSAALAMPVRVSVFDRFPAMIDAHADGRLDAAIYSAPAFAAARLSCECLDAIASATSANGATGLSLVLLPAAQGTAVERPGMLVEAAEAMAGIPGASLPGAAATELFADSASMAAALGDGRIDGVALIVASSAGAVPEAAIATAWLALGMAGPAPQARLLAHVPYGPVAVKSGLSAGAVQALENWLLDVDARDPVAHGILSDGLTGTFKPVENAVYTGTINGVQRVVSAAP
jgi:phosphonate transport system substrate-binding protein